MLHLDYFSENCEKLLKRHEFDYIFGNLIRLGLFL